MNEEELHGHKDLSACNGIEIKVGGYLNKSMKAPASVEIAYCATANLLVSYG